MVRESLCTCTDLNDRTSCTAIKILMPPVHTLNSPRIMCLADVIVSQVDTDYFGVDDFENLPEILDQITEQV